MMIWTLAAVCCCCFFPAAIRDPLGANILGLSLLPIAFGLARYIK